MEKESNSQMPHNFSPLMFSYMEAYQARQNLRNGFILNIPLHILILMRMLHMFVNRIIKVSE